MNSIHLICKIIYFDSLRLPENTKILLGFEYETIKLLNVFKYIFSEVRIYKYWELRNLSSYEENRNLWDLFYKLICEGKILLGLLSVWCSVISTKRNMLFDSDSSEFYRTFGFFLVYLHVYIKMITRIY